MRDSDVVAILAGASVPYVLRPLGDSYMLLGGCYIHDIMRGEPLRELEADKSLGSCIQSLRICQKAFYSCVEELMSFARWPRGIKGSGWW